MEEILVPKCDSNCFWHAWKIFCPMCPRVSHFWKLV